MLICRLEEFDSKCNCYMPELVGKDNLGHKIYRGINYQKTVFGDIEDSVYYPVAKELITIAGETELLESIKEHCRNHCGWLRSKQEVEEYAIKCLLLRAYEHWQDFTYSATKRSDQWIFYFDHIRMLSRRHL